MAHLHLIEDSHGDVIDQAVLCSDFCHQQFAGDDYGGWNGCAEVSVSEPCAECGEMVEGLDEE